MSEFKIDFTTLGRPPTMDEIRAAAKIEDMMNKKPTRSRAAKKGPAPSDPMVGAEEPDMKHISSAVHVYQREGETDQATRLRASRERGDHGPSVLVFQHMHQFSLPCTPSCRTKVGDDE